MAKGLTTNSVLLNRNNYALRAKRLKRHEKAGTLVSDEEKGIPGARRRFQNTKGMFKPQPAGATFNGQI